MSVFFSRPTTLVIPDNDSTGVRDTVTVDATGSLTSIELAFRFTHTYPGDLKAYLTNPVGQGNLMWEGSGNTDAVNQLVEISIPDAEAEFGFPDFNGDWKFTVIDSANNDTGTIDEWQIEFFGIGVDPTGEISASLAFDAGLVGSVDPSGVIQSDLGFDVDFTSSLGSAANLAASVGFEAALEGQFTDTWGELSANLGFSAKLAGFQDWTLNLDPIQLQEVYRLIITGSADSLDDLVLGGISSWQATNQAGDRSSYLQAVIPAASEFLNAIDARKNGDLIIQKGFVLADGTERYEEILRSNFDAFRYDRGPGSLTVTVSGYLSGKPAANVTRPLTGVRTISMNDGKYRVRCAIDLFLQPGMTVTGEGLVFTADYINYYVSETDKFCEVSER